SDSGQIAPCPPAIFRSRHKDRIERVIGFGTIERGDQAPVHFDRIAIKTEITAIIVGAIRVGQQIDRERPIDQTHALWLKNNPLPTSLEADRSAMKVVSVRWCSGEQIGR